MMLSATMAIIPHQSAINKDNKDVGVDTHYYVEEIAILMNSTSVDDLFNDAFVTIQHGDRPFTLLFFLTVAKFSQSDNLSYVFDNIPIVLGPSLVLVIYFLTRQLTSNDTASLLSAFLTAISFHTLVGIYAGSYANWLALIVGYLSIVFVLRSLKETSRFNVLLFLVLINTALFTHIYTWSILALVIGIFLLVLLKMKYYERKNVTRSFNSTFIVSLYRYFANNTNRFLQRDWLRHFSSIWINSATWTRTIFNSLDYYNRYNIKLSWKPARKLHNICPRSLLAN